jgi:hypothetical protein
MCKLTVSTILVLMAGAMPGCGKPNEVATGLRPEVAPAGDNPAMERRDSSSADQFTYGTIRAARLGQAVIVQVGFQGMPRSVNTLTLGLRLDDGSAVYPTTIHSLRNPDRELLASPEVGFRMGRGVIAAAKNVRPTRWLETTFELDAAQISANGSVFSLLLGEPETVQGCDLGMSVSVSARDDSPSLYSCILLKPAEGMDTLLSLPPAPRPEAPVASFRLSEALGKVAVRPVVVPPAFPVPLAQPSPMVPLLLPPTVLVDLPLAPMAEGRGMGETHTLDDEP